MKERKEPQRDGTFRKRNCVRRDRRTEQTHWRPGLDAWDAEARDWADADEGRLAHDRAA